MDEENRSDAAAVIAAAQEMSKAETVTVARGSALALDLLVVPSGKQVIDAKQYLDARLERPVRRTGTARMTTLESFIEHVKRFADEHTAIFAVDSPTEPALEAVLDYHQIGASGAPAWCTHRTHYRFPISDEWSAWTKTMDFDQRAFADFLEDRISDVADPEDAGEQTKEFAEQLGIVLATPSALMALSRGLSVHVGQKVSQQINTSSGEVQLQFEEEHSAKSGGPLKVPGGFVIGIPVFRAGPRYSIPVRLRYKVAGGAVRWSLALLRPDLAFRDAFEAAVESVSTETQLPVLRGKPEA